MKYALASLALLVSAQAFAVAPQQTYTRTHILYWMAGADDVVLGPVKETCDSNEQAGAQQGASNDALAACNADPAGYRCFVSSSVITWNGPFDDNMMQKYNLSNSQFSLDTVHGCEATATVFGF